MRDIKFRAWNGIKFYEPLYASGCWFRDGRSLEDGNTTNDHVMQYTGLKDKNGVKIYEGDIVRWGDDVIETVGFDDGFFKTETSCIDSCMVVIGNIYENQELLGE